MSHQVPSHAITLPPTLSHNKSDNHEQKSKKLAGPVGAGYEILRDFLFFFVGSLVLENSCLEFNSIKCQRISTSHASNLEPAPRVSIKQRNALTVTPSILPPFGSPRFLAGLAGFRTEGVYKALVVVGTSEIKVILTQGLLQGARYE